MSEENFLLRQQLACRLERKAVAFRLTRSCISFSGEALALFQLRNCRLHPLNNLVKEIDLFEKYGEETTRDALGMLSGHAIQQVYTPMGEYEYLWGLPLREGTNKDPAQAEGWALYEPIREGSELYTRLQKEFIAVTYVDVRTGLFSESQF